MLFLVSSSIINEIKHLLSICLMMYIHLPCFIPLFAMSIIPALALCLSSHNDLSLILN